MIKVFIAEDAYLLRKELILTMPWEEMNCIVIGDVGNGSEATNKILELTPDLIVTDVQMPDMTGLEVIEAVQSKIDAQYIVISGFSEFEYIKKAVDLGAINYVLKPIDDDEFCNAINKAVQKISEKQKTKEMKNLLHEKAHENPFIFESTFEKIDVHPYMKRAFNYINDNYMFDIGVSSVAQELEISSSYLMKLFKQEENITFNEYLTYVRIKHAVHMLQTTHQKVYEVSSLVGYKDYRYFSTIFRKMTGLTPKEYQIKNNTEN